MVKGSASRIFVWVILGLLIVGLAGFGATNFGGSVRTVATVGDVEIDVNAYGQELQQELRALAAQSGRTFSIAEARALGLDAAVLSRLVNRAALDDEAQRLGLSVGDEAVRDQITEIPAFRGVDGSFDREAYAFTLENAGLTIAEFEERVRNESARNILQAAVVNGARAPAAYTDTLFAWAREERDITWALIDGNVIDTPLPEPSEADLEAYHAEHAEDFTLSETKVITYAWLTPDMILDTIEVPETSLREAYDSRAADYIQPERRLVERLVFADTEAAEAARARLDAGEATFPELVAERNLTLSDIDMGDVAAEDLEDAGEAVFALEEPGVAGPLPSPLGPALYRVNAILAASETSFEDAREELEAELASDRASRAILDMREMIDDMLAGGATLEEVVGETDMELGQIDWRQDVEDGIAAYQEFRDAALVTEEGDFPELYDLDQGGLFALRVDEVRPPALQPLDEVRPQVIAGWEVEQTAQFAVERAQEAALAIEGGAEMAGLDLPLRTVRGLTRAGFIEDAPDGMVENIFQMSIDDVRVFEAEGGAAVVRLDAITVPSGEDAESREIKRQFSEAAGQGVANDVLNLFSRAIQNRAGVQVNSQAINAVLAQFQ